MTTVICTKQGMAADKRISGSPVFKSTKIHQIRGSLIGIAGNVEQALRFIEWRRTPEQKPQFEASVGFEALELTADRRLVWWGAEMVGIEIEDDYYAIGSGAQLALGALAMGATLRQAIKIAAKWDVATGTDIQLVTLKGCQ